MLVLVVVVVAVVDDVITVISVKQNYRVFKTSKSLLVFPCVCSTCTLQ